MRSGTRFTEDYNAPGSDMARIDVASGWRPALPVELAPTIRDVTKTLPAERPMAARSTTARSRPTFWLGRWSGRAGSRLPKCCLTGSGSISAPRVMRILPWTARVLRWPMAALTLRCAIMPWPDEAGRRRSWRKADRPRSVGDAAAFGQPYTALSPHGAYSRPWWIHDVKRDDFMARGVFGQLICPDPQAEFMAVKLSTWSDFLIHNYLVDMLAAVTTIRDALAKAASGSRKFIDFLHRPKPCRAD